MENKNSKKYYKYEINMVVMNILAVLLIFIPFLIALASGYDLYLAFANPFILLVMMLYFIIHEIVHGIGYSMFAKDKKNIKFGIALEKGVLFAACQEKLNKKQIVISLLLPLIVLSIIPLPFALIYHIEWLLLLIVMNFAGAIGDMLMTVLILRAPSDVEYIDYNNDVGAYLVSSEDMSNYRSFCFTLTETGDASKKTPDKSIKRITISLVSWIVIGICVAISIVSYITK